MKIPQEKIVRKRRLVFSSKVLASAGDTVRPDTVVARTMLPLPRRFYLSAFRALPQGSIEGHLAEWLVAPGEEVDIDIPIVQFTRIEREIGEVIAPGGLRAADMPECVFKSPLAGVIEDIIEETGQIRLREKVDYSQRRALVQVGQRIGVRGRKLKRYLKHNRGEFVERSQILAQRLEPGAVSIARAPMAGVITEINLEDGTVRLEREFKEVELEAGFFGQVTAITPHEIEITGQGRRVSGVCGLGGESFGRLHVAVRNPTEELTAGAITDADKGRLLVAGAFMGLDALKKAADEGVKGIITGGADHLDLCSLLGEDFAVAITGKEKAPFTVIITGEFGSVPMDEELFEFFQRHENSWAHINGTTHIRAGVIRPEIIVMSEQR